MILILRTLIAICAAAIVTASSSWLLEVAHHATASWESLLLSSAIIGTIWGLIGLCLRKQPFGLYIWIGPLVGICFIFLGMCNPFAWTFRLLDWSILLGAGLVSSLMTWMIFNLPGKIPIVSRGFPVIDEKEGKRGQETGVESQP